MQFTNISLLGLGCLLLACGHKSLIGERTPMAPFDVEGHRGCRGLLPENSIPAMKYALDLGVQTLELDVVISADGQVVVSHDPYFNHQISSHPDGSPVTEEEARSLNLYQMNYVDIKQYDVGSRQHPGFPQQRTMPAYKPLLGDLIDSADAHARATGRPLPFYNIETKTQPTTDGLYHPAPDTFVKLLMDIVRDKKIATRTIIQSFDFRTLRLVHRHYPQPRIAALIDAQDHRPPAQQVKDLGFVPDIYSPNFQLVTEDLVNTCHQRKMKVVPWTVNNTSVWKKLRAMGVDGIITDYPDLLQRKK